MDRKKKPVTIKTPASYLIVKDTQIDKNNYKQCFNTFSRIVLKLAYARQVQKLASGPLNFFLRAHASLTSSDERANVV